MPHLCDKHLTPKSDEPHKQYNQAPHFLSCFPALSEKAIPVKIVHLSTFLFLALHTQLFYKFKKLLG